MSTEAARECLTAALILVELVERRTRGLQARIANATRNADRLVLRNDLDSLRFDLSAVHELLRDAIGSLPEED